MFIKRPNFISKYSKINALEARSIFYLVSPCRLSWYDIGFCGMLLAKKILMSHTPTNGHAKYDTFIAIYAPMIYVARTKCLDACKKSIKIYNLLITLHCYKTDGEIPVHTHDDAGRQRSTTGKYFPHESGVKTCFEPAVF
jgi:hypothetical protein